MDMKHTESKPRPRLRAVWVSAAVALSTLSLPAMAEMPSAAFCGGLDNGLNGPFDFRNERQLLATGERAHFSAKVEALLVGQSRYEVGGDIHFLLVMFPNHPRALMAMMRWGEKLKTPKPPDTLYSVECYFERALRFRPDDNVARMIYAMFLSKNARPAEAQQHLDRVVASAGDNPFTHFNAGLLYFDIKQYDKALAQARTAQTLGFLRTDLIDKLKAAGKWTEPETPVAAPEAAASAASAAAPS